MRKLSCRILNLLAFFIALVLIASTVACEEQRSPTVEIWNWSDLNAIRNNLSGRYVLMRDLDSASAGYKELASETANQGKGWQPIGTHAAKFTGTFDGQGFEIRDLCMNRPGEGHVGLFGVVAAGGTVKNVGMVNAYVIGDWCVGSLAGVNWGTVSNCYSSGSVSGAEQVGGLMGGNGGTVSNSYSTSTVSGVNYVGGLVGASSGAVSNSHSTGSVSGEWRVGGLVGGMSDTTISNSYSSGTVTGDTQVGGLIGYNYGTVNKSYSTGSVRGDSYVGGLVGWNRDIVSDSYSTGSVRGEWLIGGLVGHNRGTVSKSYSTGAVTGDEDVGGLVGRNYEGSVTNSFWDIETSGQGTSDGGTGKTTAEMKDIATFSAAGWSIIAVGSPNERNPSYIWNIVNGVTYPLLSWQA